MSTDNNNDDEKKMKVGYKSPPEKSQFKKGRSGNRWGRPRSIAKKYTVADPDEALAEVLAEEVAVTANGKKKQVPRYKVVITQLVNKAMAGDTPALKFIMDRYYALGSQYKDPEVCFFRYTKEDEERDRQFRKLTEEFIETERKLKEEAKIAGKAPPTLDEICDRLERSGLLSQNHQALKKKLN